MKKLVLSLILLIACNVTYAGEKAKKKINAKKPDAVVQYVRDTAKTPEQLKWLEKLNGNLGICKIFYDMDVLSFSTKIDYKVALKKYDNEAYDTSAMYEETKAEVAKDSQYKNCENNIRTDTLSESKDFIQNLVEPNLQSTAREMIAQWLTAMDAIKQRNFIEEQSKFKSLYNSLKLSLSIG